MNERIKELFIQTFGKNNFPKGNAEVYMSADDLEKFAELIVRECAVIANKAENNDTEIRCMYDVITEHFGVEK